jgi:hypothetical protein
VLITSKDYKDGKIKWIGSAPADPLGLPLSPSIKDLAKN